MNKLFQQSQYLLLGCILSSIANLASANPLINGISVHSELGQESFIGALLTTTLSTDARDILIAQEEKQIQVRVLAERISSRRFKRMWIEGMAINAAASELEAQSRNMANFSNMLKVTLRRGDIFAIQRGTDEVKVIINGATLGTIDDPAFFDLLLRTWIGPVPLSSQFRNDLLAGGEIDEALIARFNDTRPTDARIAAVAEALANRERGQTETTGAAAAAAAVAVKPAIEAAPTISAPQIQPSIQAPTIETTRTVAQAPTPEPAATPEPEVKSTPTPAPTPAPETVAVAAAGGEAVDDIFDEEDDEEFTAESLLSQQLYIAKLKKWTYKELRYPSKSLDRNEQGIVRLSVTIQRDGKLQNIDVIEEPEFSRLTKAAVKAVEKSSPYPVMPADVTGDEFEFSMPIVFKIVEQ